MDFPMKGGTVGFSLKSGAGFHTWKHNDAVNIVRFCRTFEEPRQNKSSSKSVFEHWARELIASNEGLQ